MKEVVPGVAEEAPREESPIAESRLRSEALFEEQEEVEEEVSESEEAPSEFEKEEKEEKVAFWKSKKMIWVGAGAVVVIIAALGIFWWLNRKDNAQENSRKISIANIADNSSEAEVAQQSGEGSVEQKKEAVESAPTESVKEVLPKDLTVSVLNGGAPAGVAGKIKSLLIGKGYEKTVAKNAEKDDHTGQRVYYQAGFEKAAAQIVALLKTDYPQIDAKEASSAEEKSANIVVMLGK
jgi:cytoskeletal protein RodZ